MLVSNNIEYTFKEIVYKLGYEYKYKLLKTDGTEFTLQKFQSNTILTIVQQKPIC